MASASGAPGLIDWTALIEDYGGGVIVVDAGLCVRFANRAIHKILGHPADALIDQPISKICPSPKQQAVASPEAALDLQSLPLFPRLDALIREGLGVVRPSRGTGPLVGKEGAWVEVAWSILMPKPNPRPQALINIATVEESVYFMARPEQSKQDQIHQIVFEHAPIGIFHFDDRGVITASNEHFINLLGATRERILGLHLRSLQDEGIIRCIDEVILGRAARYDGDYTSITTGKVIPINAEFTPVTDATGKMVSGVGLVKDITEQRAAERMAARAERMASLGALAAGLVHEIKNPLSYTLANLEVAERRVDALRERIAAFGSPSSEAEKKVEQELTELRSIVLSAQHGAVQVANVTRDLRTFALADDSKKTRVRVGDAIESALKLAGQRLETVATVEKHLGEVPPVLGNDHRLVQLFVNLLVNAADAIESDETDAKKEPGRVTVDLREEPKGTVRVEISDNGRGFPNLDPSRIFEPFFTNKSGGMGLGLAICHGIVAALGGQIHAEAVSPARGARLVVALPADESKTEPPREGPTLIGPKRRGRVLVIDDEELLASTLKVALSPLHDVEIALDGRAALEMIGKEPAFDVILCDWNLPDMTGQEIYETARISSRSSAERFVFVSGGVFTSDGRSFFDRIPNARIDKPFDLASLERLIADRLGF